MQNAIIRIPEYKNTEYKKQIHKNTINIKIPNIQNTHKYTNTKYKKQKTEMLRNARNTKILIYIYTKCKIEFQIHETTNIQYIRHKQRYRKYKQNKIREYQNTE